MQGAGLRGVAFTLLEDVFDVFAGERLACDGVLHGKADFIGAVDVGQGDDLVDVDADLEAAGCELLVIVFGLRTEGIKGHQPLGVPGTVSLGEDVFDVIRVFEVAVALVAARMGGDEVVGVIEADALGERHESEAL